MSLEFDEPMDKLESEVAEMAERLSQYRSTLPRQIMSPLASTLDAHRPQIDADVAKHVPYNNHNIAEGVPFVEEGQETAERAQVLKQKISDNVSALPVLLKRMRDAISRLDKLDSSKLVIPPIYKKKRTS